MQCKYPQQKMWNFLQPYYHTRELTLSVYQTAAIISLTHEKIYHGTNIFSKKLQTVGH